MSLADDLVADATDGTLSSVKRIHAVPESEPAVFGSGSFVPPVLGRQAEAEGNLRIGPGGSLWRYKDGVYSPDGEEWLSSFVREQLGDEYRENRRREVRSWCHANPSARLPTQPAIEYINVANGILRWRESPPRLEPHTPDTPSIMQIPAAWEPSADCPTIRSFLRRVLPEQDNAECMTFLFEWIGYLLVPSAKLQRALMLLGPGDTGKSTLLALIEHVLGPANVSHHSLQSICDDRFTAGDLYGRIANICADLDAKSIGNSGKFKMVVAGDRMSAELKFKDPFKYSPFARLIFSANEAPGTADQSDAYYKRWLVLPMTRKLAAADQDPDLLAKMTAPGELSGLLKYAVAGLIKLWRRGRFDVPEPMQRAAGKYRTDTDTVVGFVEDECEFDPDARERAHGLYQAYTRWCSENGKHALGAPRFREHLESTYSQAAYKPRYGGYPTWFGILRVTGRGASE